MKIKFFLNLLNIIFLNALLFSCTLFDGEYEMKVAEKGENSFVCYINGEKYVPGINGKLDLKISPSYPLTFTEVINDKSSFYLSTCSNKLSLGFHIKSLIKTGNYNLGEIKNDPTGELINSCCVFYIRNNTKEYVSVGKLNSGHIQITELSSDNKIIKGTFEC